MISFSSTSLLAVLFDWLLFRGEDKHEQRRLC